jgi:hypothetical protein
MKDGETKKRKKGDVFNAIEKKSMQNLPIKKLPKVKVIKESNDEKTTAKNGKLCVLALLGFLMKYKRNLFNANSQNWLNDSKADNLEGKLLKNDREDNEAIYSLFNELVYHLKDQYQRKEEDYSSYSNFFKLDSTYNDVILPSIKAQYLRSERDFEKLDRALDEAFVF